jgi:hypothetical protein
MKIDTSELKAMVTHEVDVSVSLATSPVTEVRASKYAELTGMPLTEVNYFCSQGILKCRKINSKGREIIDYSNNRTAGVWYVGIKSPIRTIGSL